MFKSSWDLVLPTFAQHFTHNPQDVVVSHQFGQVWFGHMGQTRCAHPCGDWNKTFEISRSNCRSTEDVRNLCAPNQSKNCLQHSRRYWRSSSMARNLDTPLNQRICSCARLCKHDAPDTDTEHDFSVVYLHFLMLEDLWFADAQCFYQAGPWPLPRHSI